MKFGGICHFMYEIAAVAIILPFVFLMVDENLELLVSGATISSISEEQISTYLNNCPMPSRKNKPYTHAIVYTHRHMHTPYLEEAPL